MAASRSTLSDTATSDERMPSDSLPEGQIYDFITNKPVRDSPVESTSQAVARSLLEEYEFARSILNLW